VEHDIGNASVAKAVAKYAVGGNLRSVMSFNRTCEKEGADAAELQCDKCTTCVW
jgi:hypothetical protein